MTTNLVKQKENLEAYIRSTGYNTRGMNVENNHVLIENQSLIVMKMNINVKSWLI